MFPSWKWVTDQEVGGPANLTPPPAEARDLPVELRGTPVERPALDVINGTAPASLQAVILVSILREAGGAYTLLQEELEGLDRHEARERMDALQAEPELSDVQRTSLASVATVLAALS